MTSLQLRPYQSGDLPEPGTVPVTVIILTKNEAVNIERCIASVKWAAQVVVVDSESTDDTIERAQAAGAEIVVEPWRGFAAQREFALRLPIARNDWIYFVDADEWISAPLAAEIAEAVADGSHDAYAQRFRLVFMNRWMRHSGWYGGSWIVRLMRASAAEFGSENAGERARVSSVGRLVNDIVDEDHKGLAAWLHKHVSYAESEAEHFEALSSVAGRIKKFARTRRADSRPLARAIAKDLVLPLMPARPVTFFVYMYVIRMGFLDGKPGLAFCLYHAWYRMTIELLRDPRAHARRLTSDKSTAGAGIVLDRSVL